MIYTKLKTKIPLIVLIFFYSISYSQVDTIFWFAAPNIDEASGDKPIGFVFSSGDNGGIIEISQPSNPGFAKRVVTIAANSVEKLNFNTDIGIIESTPENTILNKGIKITSTVPVTAFYEISNAVNPEIFVLKGRNAMGNEFLIPSQTKYSNDYTCKESVCIVATEDNTNISINPKSKIYGYSGTYPINVTLNCGQSYLIKAVDGLSTTTLSGTSITSDKAICVTVSDDAVLMNKSSDLIGDQIIPVSLLGDEYIAIKGKNSDEIVYILASQNNTDIFINGNSSPIANIDKGESFPVPISSASVYIRTSAPAYAYHISGHKNELGSALLPHISCTGSYSTNISRNNGQIFSLSLLTHTVNISSFLVNGNTGVIKSSDFQIIPGTAGEWSGALLNLNTSLIPNGNNIISNSSGYFHLGILNKVGSSSEYGIFTDYSTIDLGDDILACSNELVEIDAGPGMNTYLWNTGATTRSITTNTPGNYWVEMSGNGCHIIDTIALNMQNINLDLGADTIVCNSDSLSINSGINNANYNWSTGEIDQNITARTSGSYHVNVTQGVCTDSDTINIQFNTSPILNLGNDTTLCTATNFNINAPAGYDSYLWNTGDNTNSVNINTSGKYFLDVIDNGCSNTDSINIAFINTNTTFAFDSTICDGENVILNAQLSGNNKYNWSTGDTTTQISVNSTGRYIVDINTGTCAITDTFNINVNPIPVLDLGNDTTLCTATSFNINAPAGYDSYLWNTGDNTNSVNISTSGKYFLNVIDNGCSNTDSINIAFININTTFAFDSTICDGENVILNAQLSGNNKYNWSTGDTTDKISVNSTGRYIVDINTGTCSITDTFNINVNPIPTLKLGNDTTLCTTSNFNINAPAGYDSYLWNTGDNTNSVNINTSGKYFLDVIDNGCSNTDSINIAFINTNTAFAYDSTICDGENIILNAQLSGNNKYNWSTGDTTTQISVNSAGRYIVDINTGTCAITDTFNINVNPIPVLNLGNDTTLCTATNFNINAPTGYDSYLWNTGDNTNSVNISSSGSYILEITENKCKISDTITVLLSDFKFDLGNDTTICSNSHFTISANVNNVNYNWSTGESSESINVTSSGKYKVEISNSNCKYNDSIFVTINPLPSISLGNDRTICQNTSTTIIAGHGFDNYLWNTGEKTEKITTKKEGLYWVKVTESSCQNTDTILLSVEDLNISLGDDKTLCSNDPIELSISQSDADILWSTGENQSNIEVNSTGEYYVTVSKGDCVRKDTVNIIINSKPQIEDISLNENLELVINASNGTPPLLFSIDNKSFNQSNIFSVRSNTNYNISVKDANDCIASDIFNTGSFINAPNFFTPNGDGANDAWVINNIENFPNAEISIFNKDGNLIIKYKGSDQHWNGSNLPSDDYWYVINLKNGDNPYVGNISIKR